MRIKLVKNYYDLLSLTSWNVFLFQLLEPFPTLTTVLQYFREDAVSLVIPDAARSSLSIDAKGATGPEIVSKQMGNFGCYMYVIVIIYLNIFNII